MTKPKKPIKPVLAWCAAMPCGTLRVASCSENAEIASYWVKDDDHLIRVEIRPAPKRKAKRGAK